MTVTDPQHPLYGKTFPLLDIEQRQDRGICCLVAREWGQNSYLPIEVTDLAASVIRMSSIPLSVRALQQLVKAYHQVSKGQAHEAETAQNKAKQHGKPTQAQRRLVSVERSAASDPPPDADAHLSGIGTATGENGGGE